MGSPLTITTWKTLDGMSDKQRHHATLNALARATALLRKDDKIATITQLAAGIFISVAELRDEASRWVDTEAKLHRITTVLRSRLHDWMLKPKGQDNIRLAAINLLKIELAERQLAADNQLTIEGSGFVVNIITYFRPGKKHKPADPPKDAEGGE